MGSTKGGTRAPKANIIKKKKIKNSQRFFLPYIKVECNDQDHNHDDKATAIGNYNFELMIINYNFLLIGIDSPVNLLEMAWH